MTHEIQTVRTDSGQDVSFQVYQDIYNTLTGKTEKIFRVIYRPYIINANDISSLHDLVSQLLEQYNVTSSSLKITLSYTDKKVERYSGLERFLLHSKAYNCAIELIDFTYDILIVLPKTHEPKPYQINIGLRSTVGMLERLHGPHTTRFERDLFEEMDRATGKISIKYIDYAVGKTLETNILHWFEKLPCEKTLIKEKYLTQLSAAALFITRLGALSVAAFGLIKSLRPEINSGKDLFEAGIIGATTLLAVNLAAIQLTSLARGAKSVFRPSSFINLTDCDESARRNLYRTRAKRIGSAIFACIAAISLGVVGNFASKFFGI